MVTDYRGIEVRRKDRTSEEQEAGLVRIGEIYQDLESKDAEIYVRVMQPGGSMVAYRFQNPEALWTKVLRYCTDYRVLSDVEERDK